MVALALVGGGVAAWAFFGVAVAPGSYGESDATTVGQGATPTVSLSANGRQVDVSWGATTLANGQAVDGYIVTRYPTGGGLGDINSFSSCGRTVSGTSCSETFVPPGSWQYTVTPVIGTNWRGAESPLSGAVTIGPETLSLNGSPYGAASFAGLPATATASGSISGFAGNEQIAYNLDSDSPPAGTALSGSPTTLGSNGSSSSVSVTIPQAAGDGPHTVWALGTNSNYHPSQASAAIVIDTVTPNVSASLSPAANGVGWNNTSPVQVTLLETDPAPSSGNGAIKYTTDGSDPTTSGTAVTYSGPFNVSAEGTTTVKFFGTDAAGNASLVATQVVMIDTVAPTNSISLTNQSGGGSLLSGTTLYYQGVNAGSFTLSNNLSDARSGPASTGYAALAGTSTGWTFTSSSATSGPPYVSNFFSWSGGTSSNPTETATGFDVAGNSSPVTFSFVNDSTAPINGAVSVNGVAATGGGSGSYSTSTSFAINSRTDYADAGSGLASSVLRVQSFTLANNACGAAAGPFSTPTTVSGTTQPGGILTAFCYVYTLTGTDNVGNVASISTTVKVDTTGPAFGSPALTLSGSGPSQFINGTTFYYNPQGSNSGSFTVTAPNIEDAQTAIRKVSFPTITGGPSGGGDVASSPYQTTYNWSSSTSGSGSQTVTAFNNAGTSSTSGFTVTPDTAAPTGGVLTVNGTGASGAGTTSYNNSGSFSISRTDYSDAGSGLASSTLTRQSAALSSSDGIADGTCGSFGSATTVNGSPTQNLSGPACYLYTLTGTDNVGNSVSISTIVKVDTTGPIFGSPAVTLSGATGNTFISGTTVYINAQAGKSGSFLASASATDNDSGMQKINFPALSGFTSGGGDDTTSPYSSGTYNWSGAVGASGVQNVTATNNAAKSSTSSFTVTPDTTNPGSGALTVNGQAASGVGTTSYNNTGSFSISRTDYSDAGSGLASSTLTRQTGTLSSSDGIADGTCSDFGSSATLVGAPSQSLAGPACYLYTLTGTDNVGNTVSISTTVKVDTTGPIFGSPAVTLSGATGNTFISGTTVYINAQAGKSGSFSASVLTTDPDSGILNVVFPSLTGFSSGGGTDASSPYSSGTYNWSGTVGASGLQNVTARDNANLTATSPFTVTPDTTNPTVPIPTVTPGYFTALSVPVTLGSATDAGSGVATATIVLQRASATLSNGSCGSFGSFSTIATNPSSPFNDATVVTNTCYEYREQASDNVGNANTSGISNIAKVDATNPTQALSLTGATGGGSFLSGATLYYQGSTAGTFKIQNAVSDAGSGPASSQFGALGGTTTGWSFTGSTVSTPAGGPYVSNTLSWSASTSSSPTEAVTSSDAAGNTVPTTLTFANDSTAPSGGSISVPARVHAASVPVTFSVGTDGGSGINTATAQLKRASATYTVSTDSCGSFGSFTNVGSAGPTSPFSDATVANNNCYEYQYVVSDNVGNTVTYGPTSPVKVDTTAPTGLSITAVNGGTTSKKTDTGDVITFTFSENIDPSTITSAWSVGSTPDQAVTVQFSDDGTGNGTNKPDNFTISTAGVHIGSVSMSDGNWVPTKNGSYSFNATMHFSTNGGGQTVITVTLGALQAGGTTVGAVSGSDTFTWMPDAAITDLAGNSVNTSTTPTNTVTHF